MSCLQQRCPTGGPRAASGPPTLPIWPVSVRNHSKPSNDSNSRLFSEISWNCYIASSLDNYALPWRIAVSIMTVSYVFYKLIVFCRAREMYLSNDEFWRLVSGERFPKLYDFALRFCSLFDSTYVCESAFSVMKHLKSKTRNRLDSEMLSACIYVWL